MKNYVFRLFAIVALTLGAPFTAWANPNIGTLSDKKDKAQRVGVATVVSNDGYILTSSALVGRQDQMFFMTSEMDEPISASVIAVDNDLGVALLEIDVIDGESLSPIIFSKKYSVKADAVTSLVGNGEEFEVSEGAISNTLIKGEGGARFLKHNAIISKSGYGGVLVNECGEAVGFNVVDPFLTVRRARRMPEPEGFVYAAGIKDVLKFLDTRGVKVQLASHDCLSAAEKAAELERQKEQDQAMFDKKSKEKQAELDRVQQDLIEKQEISKEAQKRADEAEKNAKEKAAEVERLKKDKAASTKERETAEEEFKTAREDAEKAAIDAAAREEEISNLTAEQAALKAAVDANEKHRKQLIIGGGIGFALLTLFAGLLIGRRNKALKVEQAEKAGVIQQLNATFSNIECRGQDQNNAPHAFIINGNSLLKSSQGLVVGRQPQSSDILINHPEISRAHLRVVLKNNNVYVEDLGSTNGSALNSASLSPHVATLLSTGDVLSLGKVTFQVRFLDV